MPKSKIVSAEVAVCFIKDGDTVASAGFVGSGFAEEIGIAIEEAFLQSGKPRNLTLLSAAGQGDGKNQGAQPSGA